MTETNATPTPLQTLCTADALLQRAAMRICKGRAARELTDDDFDSVMLLYAMRTQIADAYDAEQAQISNDEDEDDTNANGPCDDCARSYGPHYTGCRCN